MKRKNPKAQKALNLAAALSKAGPPPRLLGLAPDKNRIVEEQQKTALLLWARQKMGVYFGKYLDQANRNFLTLVYMAVTIRGQDLTTALKQTPYSIPLKLAHQKQTVPFDLSTFIQIKREYDRLLPAIQTIKGKTRHHSAAQKVSLAEELKISDKKTLERYLEMKASDIVLDRLRSKHKLTVFRSHLHLSANPLWLVMNCPRSTKTSVEMPSRVLAGA